MRREQNQSLLFNLVTDDDLAGRKRKSSGEEENGLNL